MLHAANRAGRQERRLGAGGVEYRRIMPTPSPDRGCPTCAASPSAGSSDASGALAQFPQHRRASGEPVHELRPQPRPPSAGAGGRDAGETADARKAYADFLAMMRGAGAKYPLLAHRSARDWRRSTATTPASTR